MSIISQTRTKEASCSTKHSTTNTSSRKHSQAAMLSYAEREHHRIHSPVAEAADQYGAVSAENW